METLKSIFRVASSNIFNLGSSFILGFVLPMYISTYDYGKYREYMLYITFIYIFNLGFNDGIYIEYGGRDRNDINIGRLKTQTKFVRILQIAVFIIILILSIIMKDTLLFYIAFASYFMNVIQYHKNFLQATGEFTLYSKLNMYNTILNVVLMLVAVFLFNSKHYSVYIFVNVLALSLSYLFYEYFYYKNYGRLQSDDSSFTKSHLINLLKIGITVLLSNMMVTFVANLGSWVVNIFYSTEEFAQYSFSTSLLNIILLVVNAVSLVFYNMIAKEENQKLLIQLKKVLLLLGIIGGVGYFIFSWIIRIYISKYVPALSILSITFVSIPYIMVSNVIFNNIYKTRNDKKIYLKDMLKFLSISIVLIGIVTLLTDKMEYIAIATTSGYILWYLFVTRFKFTYLLNTKKETFLMVSHIIMYWLSINVLSNLFGVITYFIYLLLILFLYRNDIREIIQSLK